MNQSFNQSVIFTLDKPHFQECFEQSAPPVYYKDFAKAAILGAAGFGLLFIDAEHYYIPFFLIGLAIIELVSLRYRKTWWVWRQLIGKSANDEVTLVFNDSCITIHSNHINLQILWDNVTAIEQTELGILLRHKDGVNYLSNSHLSKEIIAFVLGHKK